MKTLLPIALLASLTSSLCAQRFEPAALPVPGSPHHKDASKDLSKDLTMDVLVSPVILPEGQVAVEEPASEPEARRSEPVPDLPFSVSLRLVRDGHLIAKLSASGTSEPFLGLLLAAVHSGTVQLPSLPPLLKTDYVVATGIEVAGMTFLLGPAMLGFDVYVQGVGVTASEIAASSVLRIAGSYEPAAK